MVAGTTEVASTAAVGRLEGEVMAVTALAEMWRGEAREASAGLS